MSASVKWNRLRLCDLESIVVILDALFEGFDISFCKHYHLPSNLTLLHHYQIDRVCNLAEKIAMNDEIWQKTAEKVHIRSIYKNRTYKKNDLQKWLKNIIARSR